jgi:hypothetical protein
VRELIISIIRKKSYRLRRESNAIRSNQLKGKNFISREAKAGKKKWTGESRKKSKNWSRLARKRRCSI